MPNEVRRARPFSLALRITLLVGVLVAALLVVFTALVARSLDMHFVEQDLSEIQAVAESLAEALGPAPAAEDRTSLQTRLARAVAGHHGVYYSVHDESGQSLFGNTPRGLDPLARARPAALSLNEAALQVWWLDGAAYRGALLNLRGESVLVAVSMRAHLHYLAQLRRGLAWGTLAACAVAVLGVWLAVRWGHAPLRRIGATVRGITSEHLHVRLDPGAVPLELDPLVTAFNTMLDQLQASFTRLTHFSADIAHELRTPVTNLTTQTQVALSKPREPDVYREVLYSSLEELERMAKMIGDMLYLAQAEHPLSKPEMSPVDLAAEVQALFEFFEAWAEDAGVTLRLDGSAPVFQGDRLMLRRALSNLLSNALRYTPRGKSVTVTLAPRDTRLDVAVQNPGAEIPAQHLPHLFDRFYRVDPARQHLSDGAGLGLAIVKSIVAAHGGTVSVDSGAGLTRFTLSLPLTPFAG